MIRAATIVLCSILGGLTAIAVGAIGHALGAW